jgi:hypothetical protein
MNTNELSAERRHDIRYHVQQYFIPEMVECVEDGYLPYIALFPSAQWYSNLRMEYDIEDLKAAKVWESFEKIQMDEDKMIILYTFPQPQDVPEAIYGAVLVNQTTNEVKYFLLEASYEDKWAVCSRNTSMHSCHEFWDSPDKEKFIEWVVEHAEK